MVLIFNGLMQKDDEDAAKAYDHFQREHYPDPITNFLLSGNDTAEHDGSNS